MDEIEKVLREKPIVLPRYLFNYYQRLGITRRVNNTNICY